MYKTEYLNRMNSLVGDCNTYVNHNREPTTSLNNSTVTIIKEALKKRHINNNTYKRLAPHAPTPPKIYGLVKTHNPCLLYTSRVKTHFPL